MDELETMTEEIREATKRNQKIARELRAMLRAMARGQERMEQGLRAIPNEAATFIPKYIVSTWTRDTRKDTEEEQEMLADILTRTGRRLEEVREKESAANQRQQEQADTHHR